MALPNAQIATGSTATPGTAATIATLAAPGADGYAVLLNGASVATAAASIAVLVLDPGTGTYVQVTTIGNPTVAIPVALATGTSQIIQIPAGFAGVQVATLTGTATGTFRASIVAY